MIENIIAKRYAKALLRAALDENKSNVDLYGDQLAAFLEVTKTENHLLSTLSNKYFDLFARERTIENLGEKLGFAKPVTNFLKVLLHKRRIEIFATVYKEYVELANEEMGRLPMQVISASELTEEQYSELVNHFQKQTGKEILLEKKTDGSVLGGVRILISDEVFDYTISNQLGQLRQKLVA